MRNKASAIALMIGLGTVGIILTYGEAARACNTTETIAGIDFSDCKSIWATYYTNHVTTE